MSIRTQNQTKKRLPCLRCGKLFWTDRCHRICKRCVANSGDIFVKPVFSAEGITLMGDYPLAEELQVTDGEDLGDANAPALDEKAEQEADA